MSRILRVVVVGAVGLGLAALVIPVVMRTRANSDRQACENHLRELGLVGVRHAARPGKELPAAPRDELPPGTFVNPGLPPDRRLSWYAYLLNVLQEGITSPDPQAKHRPPAGLADLVRDMAPDQPWDAAANQPLASYRLASAICPAQLPTVSPGQPVPTNYVASGGLGLDTPAKAPDQAGPKAGAYWYDGPTPNSLFQDGLSHTIQLFETNANLAPWLQGGPGTLRALDVGDEPYIGRGRPVGGCHPGGANVAMADGSVRFVKDTVDPTVFRAMLTRAGGPQELAADAP